MIKSLFEILRRPYRVLRCIDRVLANGSWGHLELLACLLAAVMMFLFGVGAGLELSPSSMWGKECDDSVHWSVVYHFMDAGNQHSVASGARPFALLVTVAGLICISAVTSVITNMLERRAERYRKGMLNYRYRGHVVVFGANDVLPGLLRQLCGDGEYGGADVVVMTSGDVDSLRMRTLSDLPKKAAARVEFNFGRRDSKESIDRMRVGHARCIFILGEDNEVRDSGECAESYHDALNMECLRLVADAIPDGKNPVPCHVMFEYQTMFSVFQFSNLSDVICRKIDFKPFNFYEMWAQKLLVGRCSSADEFIELCPLDGTVGIGLESNRHVHLIVVGMSKAGIALAIEAAHVAHYPNFTRDPQRCRTRITFIDRAADEEMNFFKGRFADMFDVARWRYADAAEFADRPFYGEYSADDKTWHDPLHGVNAASPYSAEWLGDEVVDIDWEFIRGSVESPEVKRYLCDAAADGSAIVTVAVCLMQTHRAVAAAMYLPSEVYGQAERIFVHQPYNSAVVDNISNSVDCGRYRRLRPFGMRSECFDMSLVDDRAARMLNYVYEKKDTSFAETEANAAEINRRWCNCSVANRWSNIYGVNSLWTKLRSVAGDWERLREECMSQTEHNRWNVEKLLMGFRPVTREEQARCIESPDYKKELKKRRIHLDICSCERLRTVDAAAVGNDEVLISALHNIFCPDERINKLYDEL